MTSEACSGCGTRFATGFLRCPRCRAVAPLFADRVKESKMPRITSDGPSNAAAQPGEPGHVAQDAEVSLVAISGEPGPELVNFTGGETVVPLGVLAEQQEAEAASAPEKPAPTPKRASGRKLAGGAS